MLTWEDRQKQRVAQSFALAGHVPTINKVIQFAREMPHNPRVVTTAKNRNVIVVFEFSNKDHAETVKHLLTARSWSFVYQPIVFPGDRAIIKIEVTL